MEISVASSVINGVVGLLTSLHWQAELPFKSRVEVLDKLQSITTAIRAVLSDAEEKQLEDPAVNLWLERLKDTYYDLNDALEELTWQAEKKIYLSGLPLSFSSLFGQYMAYNELQRLQDKIEEIARERSYFQFRESNPEVKWQERRIQSSESLWFVRKIHGRDDDERTLISKLLSRGGQDQEIQCISIVGSAGIGKTALAQLVYNNPEVRSCYDLMAWVAVSERFEARQIVIALLNCCGHNLEHGSDLESLQTKLRQTILGKRCLFVLDDVWLTDRVMWLALRNLFICAPGSKILITTQNMAVAIASGSTDRKQLSGLSEEACWSIIKDHAFDTSTDKRDIEMIWNQVGREIVQKCHGVPIIAKSLGGTLRHHTSIEDWQRVLRSNVWDSAALRSALMLSYSMMPSILKQCLLYCSIFPKNHYIDVDRLIKLWMAQSFFVASSRYEMETQGRAYCEELLSRSIFQEYKQDENGNFKCKLEGAMCDFLQFMARNECHIMLLDYKTEHAENHIPTKPRHCTLNVAPQASLPASIAYAEKLHTLMIMSEYSSMDPTALATLLRRMRRLRALDLSSCSIKELPSKAGELLLLRYLDLSFNHDLKKLPEAICNLLNLQTLNLNGCDSLRKLPKGIGKLIKLRHLEILWTTSLSYLPKGIASLTSLRTLNRFFGSKGAGSRACNLGDLENLNSLQGCITIDGLGGGTGVSEAVKAGLKNKKHLLGLELWFSVVGSERSDEALLKALKAPPDLLGLGIFYYRGELFPDWMMALEKLTKLMLANCSNCNSLHPLGKLPSLESLKIKNMPNVEKVDSEFLGIVLDNADGGLEGSSSTVAFPKLKMLCFQMLDNWNEWTEINGNGRHVNIMPSLSSLSIVSCAKISSLPDYINGKENLQRDFKDCPLLMPQDRE